MSVADPERLSYFPLSLRSGGGWWQRGRLLLVASWRAAELDGYLAAGVNPGATPLLATRSRRLTSPRYRTRIAAGLARATRDAMATTRGFSAAVRPDRSEVIAARTVLATLDQRLRATEPVSAQGIAMLESLLTDGASPLYLPNEPGSLGSRLRAAAAALEPLERRDSVRLAQEISG